MNEPTIPVAPESAPASGGKAPAKSSKRRGVVLIAVLIIVASLSLAGYHYSDSMTSEYKASENAHGAIQARACAAAGVHYTAAMLSHPDNFNNLLMGNPWNNALMFQNIAVDADATYKGRFSIISGPALDDNSDPSIPYYGVIDENRKINPNVLMKIDPTGKKLYNVLLLLPNMTQDVANSIVAWMGGSYGLTNGGAPNDYYLGLSPPYRAKSGPLDSIDELLMVRNVTRDLLYGSDYNRNGTQETNELGPIGYDRGLASYLTVYSREQNSDPNGVPYVYLKNTDLSQLYQLLTNGGVSDEMAKYIVMYRQYPPPNSTSTTQTMNLGGNIITFTRTTTPIAGDLTSFPLDFTKQAAGNQVNTLYDLIGTSVTISKSTKDDKGKTKTTNTVYQCPLNDPAKLADQFPKLYAVTTNTDPTKSTEIPARINILTAPKAVLLTLPALVPALKATDIDNIIAARPMLSSTAAPDPTFTTPLWLMSQAKLKQSTLTALDPYITTRKQVYRVQSIGYFDDRKAAIRIEAVIDTNAGRPRILMWRELSELGKGLVDSSQPAASP